MNPIVLLRVIGVLLLVRLVGRFLVAVVRAMREQTAGGPGPAGGPATPSGGEMVRDRVCNTFVPRDRALRALIGGQEAHFCSAACRDRALVATP
jgi:hypothetical protein